jgi:predicted RNA binding protein YcfA (HicA-like mRNA interferase family)
MTGRELVKLVESQGWVLERVTGSHHIFKHPERPDTVVVTVHGKKEVAKGLEKAILKQIGLR